MARYELRTENSKLQDRIKAKGKYWLSFTSLFMARRDSISIQEDINPSTFWTRRQTTKQFYLLNSQDKCIIQDFQHLVWLGENVTEVISWSKTLKELYLFILLKQWRFQTKQYAKIGIWFDFLTRQILLSFIFWHHLYNHGLLVTPIGLMFPCIGRQH